VKTSDFVRELTI